MSRYCWSLGCPGHVQQSAEPRKGSIPFKYNVTSNAGQQLKHEEKRSTVFCLFVLLEEMF